LPEQYDELIVEALDDVRTPSPLDELLQQLDPARREHIFIASLEALDWDWEWNGIHVAHIAFTEPIARAVVARTHDVPEQFDGAVGAVTRAGKAGRKLLTRLDLTKSHSATRDKLLAAI
jgi:hypothetical protein